MQPEKFNESKIHSREEKVLAFWNDKKIFEKSLQKNAPRGDFVFYDGPPFATGLPHYGHILAGTIKDVIPRYKTMCGFNVPRRWGWDCHGLPVENLVEKELGLKSKKDIIEYGIDRFNTKAKESVMRYAEDWRKIIPRLGRWVDMENDYETMDVHYTETVWWMFKELHKKGLIYEGKKSMHVCPRCETTLSNFEVAQGYKDVTDISVYVKFPIHDKRSTLHGAHLIAWTTTPWTLPGNVALAVNPELTYVKIKVGDEFYILAEPRLLASAKEGYEVVEKISGNKLVGLSYVAPFSYYQNNSKLENSKNSFKVYSADFVTADNGTGIVHIAPAFGEDDYNLSLEKNLSFVQHVGMDGKFVKEVTDFAGQSVKPKEDPSSADVSVIKYLASKNLLFGKEKITHSYPHCWRCDTPLLNYATSSWFVKVSAIRDSLVKRNKEVEWIPPELGENRFGEWLKGARDWAISRSRFWGAPIPVWKCESCKSEKVVGSMSELSTSKSQNKYFVMRHGEAENNVLGILSTTPDVPHHLTKKGKEQVAKVAKTLRGEGIDLIIASPFIRTRESAMIVADTIDFPKEKIIWSESVRELQSGVFDGQPIANYQNFFKSYLERFTKKPEGGESYMDIKRRMGVFLSELESKYKNKKILIVTHDAPGWLLFSAAKGMDIHETNTFRGNDDYFIKNGEVKRLDYAPYPRNNDFERDLHRPGIDSVMLPCSCGGVMKRVPEVFDCWFESGSMPYASNHYPFENRDKFEPKSGWFSKSRGFPADFIAEGLDQTRGWFYSLHVLGTALFGRAPFKRVVVNGIILTEDGQKMSKRLNNYPDPMEVVSKYGADALRLYLLNSPAVRGEDFRFSEKGVDEVAKKIFGRLDNVLQFYKLYAGTKELSRSKNKYVLDQWIEARLEETISQVTKSLEAGELDRATRPFSDFVEDLSTWYLRRSRDRIKNGGSDAQNSLSTLENILLEISKTLAPFAPFFAEYLYSEVGGKKESVHLENWIDISSHSTSDVLSDMKEVRRVVSEALEARSAFSIKVRQPLSELRIKHTENLKDKEDLLMLIKDEVNVKKVIFDDTIRESVELNTTLTPELKDEGFFRDLLRAVQEKRKDAGATVGEEVSLYVGIEDVARPIFEKHISKLKESACLKAVAFETFNPDQKTEIADLIISFRVVRE